jgi:hypothetical protein
MTDTILLTIPTASTYRGVATLVLGGIGSRLDLPYERVDDLQLALLSVLDAGQDGEVSVEVTTDGESMAVAVGPLVDGSAANDGLARVLGKLVDAVEPLDRDGDQWLSLRIAYPRPG